MALYLLADAIIAIPPAAYSMVFALASVVAVAHPDPVRRRDAQHVLRLLMIGRGR